MFGTVLIANRGEIACRVIRTCRRLGIRTVAVCSEADRTAAHVRAADAHVVIGPAPARESYLSIGAVLAAAQAERADAVHPGYGFLSENPDFAAACEAAGIAFIGPPPDAMAAMALKGAAKRIAREAGVPTLPGYEGADQSPEVLAEAAERIGFPVLLKPVAGGGGKGMRVVEDAAALPKALAASAREALASCGDATVLIEKFLRSPRHVEIQVVADGFGTVLHLWERDCSAQRRHQKVVEEAPAPRLPEATRAAMAEAACALARRIGYRGVGTVEFLVDGADRSGAPPFFFIEMNTRLQVEHPVTEMITGLDLVELQLRVASGQTLGLVQADINREGHAIEARICAENPRKKFFPSPGTIVSLRFPPETRAVRVDTGVAAGDSITPFYDSLIAKLVVHGSDRAGAIAAMAQALDDCAVEGIATNLELLRAVVRSDAFRDARIDTNFVEQVLPELLPL